MLGHLAALAYGSTVVAGQPGLALSSYWSYPRPMPARSKLSRKAKLWFLAIYTAFGVAMSVGSGYTLWGDLNGSNVTATVVAVYSQTAYTVTYITEDGVRCTTPHKWDRRAEPVKASDTFEVRYSKILPCNNVRRADAGFSWFGYLLIAPVLMTAGLTAFFLVKRRPQT